MAIIRVDILLGVIVNSATPMRTKWFAELVYFIA